MRQRKTESERKREREKILSSVEVVFGKTPVSTAILHGQGKSLFFERSRAARAGRKWCVHDEVTERRRTGERLLTYITLAHPTNVAAAT